VPWGRRPTPCRPVPGLRREGREAARQWGQDWHARLRVGQAQGRMSGVRLVVVGLVEGRGGGFWRSGAA